MNKVIESVLVTIASIVALALIVLGLMSKNIAAHSGSIVAVFIVPIAAFGYWSWRSIILTTKQTSAMKKIASMIFLILSLSGLAVFSYLLIFNLSR